MDRQDIVSSASSEWKEGWPVVLSGFVGISTPAIMLYTMGLFVGPLQAEFGWSRSQITLGLTIYAIVAVLLSPFVGALVDRHGSRRFAVPGVVIFLSCFASLSLVGGEIFVWWSFWLLLSLAALLVMATVWTIAVASRFNSSRGLAMAVMLSGTALASVVAPAVGGLILDQHGWRATYVGLAILWAVCALPLILLFFYSAVDLNRREVGRGGLAKIAPRLEGVELGDAVRSATFVKLTLSVFLISVVLTGALVHFVPLMISLGKAPKEAATIAGVIGLAAIGGRLMSGTLLDQINGAMIGAVAFGLPVIAFVCLLVLEGTGWQPFLVAMVIGLSVGAELEISAYLVTRHFGMRRFATLFAIITATMSLAIGLGPLLVSTAYDLSGTYRSAIWAAIPISLLAAVLVGTLGPYPEKRTVAF